MKKQTQLNFLIQMSLFSKIIGALCFYTAIYTPMETSVHLIALGLWCYFPSPKIYESFWQYVNENL